MLRGAPDVLYSEFHLKYAMILNLMRMEGGDPQDVMRRSYRQFQTERALPQIQVGAQQRRFLFPAFVFAVGKL